jgi:hypothetical protein
MRADARLSSGAEVEQGMLFLLACAATNPVLKDDKRQSQELTEAAGQYWRALRWGDAPRAKSFLEDADVKRAFDEWLNAEGKEQKLTDVLVLNVLLDPPADKPVDHRLREGTVTIRTEGYAVTDNVVHEETVDQRWYRTESGWYVVWP